MDNETIQYVEYATELAKWTLTDGRNLIRLLNVMANFPDYSMNNQLLVMAYNPEAGYIKTYEESMSSLMADVHVLLFPSFQLE